MVALAVLCSCLDGGKLVNSFVDVFRNLVNMTTFVYVSFA